MSRPLVSICLPNLNTIAYLPERIDTILGQTYKHWELVVSDNHSDDGAWPFFQRLARIDSRVSIAQAPREGLYPNWNRCIERAGGEFVYIATSDDTMPPDCLDKLVTALEANPDCDLAHCQLRAIDESGGDAVETQRWWLDGSLFAQSSGPLLHHLHVRRAPFDGLLHLLGASVYVSITQLLIRRRLFDRIGLFDTRWGSVGDFNWDMRAALVANTVHVPDTWGGWRIREGQATASAAIGSPDHERKIDSMIDHALETCHDLLTPAIRRLVTSQFRLQARELRTYEREFDSHRSRLRKAGLVVQQAVARSSTARDHLRLRLRKRPMSDWVESRLRGEGICPLTVQPVQPVAPMVTA